MELTARKINFSVQEMKPAIPTAWTQWNVAAGWCLLVVSLCWAILACWRGWDFHLGEEGIEFHTVSGKLLVGSQMCGYKKNWKVCFEPDSLQRSVLHCSLQIQLQWFSSWNGAFPLWPCRCASCVSSQLRRHCKWKVWMHLFDQTASP